VSRPSTKSERSRAADIAALRIRPREDTSAFPVYLQKEEVGIIWLGATSGQLGARHRRLSRCRNCWRNGCGASTIFSEIRFIKSEGDRVVKRKLAAILAADVVGYSRLIRADEASTLAATKTLWREVVRPAIRERRGRVFKLLGDGLLAEFASVVDAVAAAEGIQAEANKRSEAEPEDRRIQLRIGINLGDVVMDGADLYGDGVNLAARLQEVAEPGGIAVSASTYEHLRGKTGIAFADVGERQLKNIAEPVRVWLWHSALKVAASERPIESRSSQPSIAVLPFRNHSVDPDAEFFADGMTEDVIDALSKFRWLVVIARGTMFTYKGKSLSEAQVAKELNVRYVLEGSIRQSGLRMRLSAQLTDSRNGSSIWSQRFDRQLDDIFAIQDEITNAIAAAIAPEIDRAERSRATRRPRVEVDAWLFYQQGLAAYYRLTEEGLDESIGAFRKAQQADPQFAPAWAMEAVALARLAQNYRLDELGNMKSAVDLATKARLIDPRDPLTWWASGRVFSVMKKHAQAIEHIEEAITLNPNYAMAWFGLANVLMRTQSLDRAETAVDKAIALSPFDPFMPIFQFVRGNILQWLGRHEEAIKCMEGAIQQGYVSVLGYVHLAVAYRTVGNTERAKQLVAYVRERFPTFSLSAHRKFVSQPNERLEIIEANLRQLGVPEE
jgi:adenylate cyclase